MNTANDSSPKNLPIGIFDSGVGGLTVLHALQQLLPYEQFLYLGDTARLPYGTKSATTVQQYALNANEILINRGIKALVIACNTASAVALEALQQKFSPLPVIGVILPGALASLTIERAGPIVVLATEGTVKWHAYRQILANLAPERQVIEWPCSLLVALAEEGWCEGPLVEQIIAKLLAPLQVTLASPSCVVLGCTHFPVFKTAIEQVLGSHIPVIDPAHSVAEHVRALLLQHNLLSEVKKGQTHFMATDSIERFTRVAQNFLKKPLLHAVELVTVYSKWSNPQEWALSLTTNSHLKGVG